jgi:flagellar hook-associated protein 1 FlgK
MTSSFGGLNTAYTGLAAARQGLSVVGDNITNATTVGYSRQAVETSSLVPASESPFTSTQVVGEGVSVDGVTRINSPLLDAQVRTTSASDGFAQEYSTQMSGIESALNEPGDNGLSSSLQSFWSAWQNVSNTSTSSSSATTVIAAGKQVAAQISAGYTAASNQWSSVRGSVDNTVTSINAAASQIATLNGQIRSTVAAGGNANGLMDQADVLATKISNLSGATVRNNADGTMDVLLGGNPLVSGTTVNTIAASGSETMDGAAASPVTIKFVNNAAATATISGGTLGADLAVLAPADPSGNGTGGAIAEAAASYNSLAKTVASSVNSIMSTGYTAAGVTGLSFFTYNNANPATSLSVVPTDATGIAAGAQGAGAANGDVANKIAALTSSTTGPDSQWANFVVQIGNSTSAASNQASLTSAGLATAVNNQASVSSVNTDQETTNMLTYQNAFSAAARVMTTVDDMLNTLINKTGLVGIN